MCPFDCVSFTNRYIILNVKNFTPNSEAFVSLNFLLIIRKNQTVSSLHLTLNAFTNWSLCPCAKAYGILWFQRGVAPMAGRNFLYVSNVFILLRNVFILVRNLKAITATFAWGLSSVLIWLLLFFIYNIFCYVQDMHKINYFLLSCISWSMFGLGSLALFKWQGPLNGP